MKLKEKVLAFRDKCFKKLKSGWEKIKNGVKGVFAKILTLAVEHPEEAATITFVAVQGTKFALKQKKKRDDHRKLHRRFYDYHAHMWVESTRDLSPMEQLELERRSMGPTWELKADVLRRWGILKY